MSVLPRWLVLGFARLGPIGLIKVAPGTWGSALGLAYFYFFVDKLGSVPAIVINFVAIIFAVYLCGEAEVRLDEHDPGAVILDEFVAMPLCFIGWTRIHEIAEPWAILFGGFMVFRFLDILKPFGIRRLQSLPSGWGVVMDDLAAALLTCGMLHAAHFLLPQLMLELCG
ncbi:MAG TPA: phosphatidylglycerophosphatase A [Opitutaceae bacterium]|nr:phosphatidylglycerophosphatase A [Opitutaceae bacterium]